MENYDYFKNLVIVNYLPKWEGTHKKLSFFSLFWAQEVDISTKAYGVFKKHSYPGLCGIKNIAL